MRKKTCLIIGAGPAGLSAAYELLKHPEAGIHPIVLEESGDIGGISKTIEYKGNRIDIGGHRFFSKSEEVMNLWQEIMPLQGAKAKDDLLLSRDVPLSPEGPDPEKEDRVMLTRHRISRIYYLKKFFDYPVSMRWSTFRNMGFRRTWKAGWGYIGSCIHKRKEDSLADFYINRFGKPLYQMFFEGYTEKVWGRNPNKIDPSWGAQRVKGLSLWKTIGNAIARPFRRKGNKGVETSLIESFYYPKKGPGQLYETMADLIRQMGGEIRMHTKVTGIRIEDNRIAALVLNDKEEICGDYVISSMPLKDLFLAAGEKAFSKEAYDAATTLPYRDFITVGLLCKKLLLNNGEKPKFPTVSNILPDTWIYIQEGDVKLGRLQIFNNWSPYMVADLENTVWLGLEYFATEGDSLWEMDERSFIEMAKKEVVSIGVAQEEDIIDAVRFKIKKAYPAYFDSYDKIDLIREELNKIDNLYCVGRNGQHRYNNMDHSILTALTAVSSILDPEKVKKESVWDVNTEKEYHETKKEQK
ncbi:MAG: NAD(P)/FAD-dependent oxidoreductase [Bacilli bacterium]|nr:NAD(P)/FAD-dependent oxidoreductase [Bacilli bacterium]